MRKNAPQTHALADRLKDYLWAGQVDEAIATLPDHAERLGPPEAGDGPDHPRRLPANNMGYFTNHRQHMDYPTHRQKSWPIGSGVTESAVKLFDKPVKGTERFSSIPSAESIESLGVEWLSQDDRWTRYWNNKPAYKKAA